MSGVCLGVSPHCVKARPGVSKLSPGCEVCLNISIAPANDTTCAAEASQTVSCSDGDFVPHAYVYNGICAYGCTKRQLSTAQVESRRRAAYASADHGATLKGVNTASMQAANRAAAYVKKHHIDTPVKPPPVAAKPIKATPPAFPTITPPPNPKPESWQQQIKDLPKWYFGAAAGATMLIIIILKMLL